MLRFLIFSQVICALDCIVSFVDLIWLTIWLIIAFSFWLLVIMSIKLVTAIVVQIWGKIIIKKFELLNDDIVGLCEFIYISTCIYNYENIYTTGFIGILKAMYVVFVPSVFLTSKQRVTVVRLVSGICLIRRQVRCWFLDVKSYGMWKVKCCWPKVSANWSSWGHWVSKLYNFNKF